MLQKGLVHAYYGDGKGKTTAAIGLGIRGIGNGLKVTMVQFLKTKSTGELKALERLGNDFKVYRFESPKGFYHQLNEAEKELLRTEVSNEFEWAIKAALECDILILDEILGVIENNLMEAGKLTEFIKNKPRNLEIVMTGRDLPEEVKDLCDYVSEIISIKHPYNTGTGARKGIEY